MTVTQYLNSSSKSSLITGAIVFSMPWNVKATGNMYDNKLDNKVYRMYVMNKLKGMVRRSVQALTLYASIMTVCVETLKF